MNEFALIRQIFMPVAEATGTPAVRLGPGDDCAIQRLPPGTELVFSIDTLVEGVHFPTAYSPRLLGWRSLAVAASDLAAMGADPVCFTLALTLPFSSEAWLKAFALGLSDAAKHFGLALAGGDTTRGPLTLSLQVHGTVPAGQAILRSGARPGDLIGVSGTLGDARAALNWLNESSPSRPVRALLDRYHRPEAKLALGQLLRGRASAAVDVSDGLLADLGHILVASRVGARLIEHAIPRSAALMALHSEQEALAMALNGGDDYEICFTVAPDRWPSLEEVVSSSELTIIGEVIPESGIWLNDGHQDRTVISAGYDHFGGDE